MTEKTYQNSRRNEKNTESANKCGPQPQPAQSDAVRLNKYLAQCGVCSRRDADVLIAAGKVLVNGRTAGVGQTVTPADSVEVDGKLLRGREKKVVLAYYKPVGVTCTERDVHADRKITDMIDYPVRVTYAGRLDKDSEGLLLLSNDGDLINAMMRGANAHEKEYTVKVTREVTQDFLDRMAGGVYLSEMELTTRPCDIMQTGKYTFQIILTQGINRQIRRMCKELGYEVKSIRRIRVLNIVLDGIKPGAYRELTEEEYRELYEGAGLSYE